MYKHNILFIGLDTHKVSTEVAYIEDHCGAKPVHYGKIKTTKAAITKLARISDEGVKANCIFSLFNSLLQILSS
ncbi:hypothetical protein MTCD1_03664 [Colwellia marinimaniae]|uniref:IS110 family transposase n=1 Tax=Colwellia marinimaniae TaxID=1513592 RepID=A0ABQ0N1L7_9GAMM|nr:hypothetical protein MTCD1_03664 [Colwellia marinimaniae]